MGALPDRLPGFQYVENDALRATFDAAWGVTRPAEARLAPRRRCSTRWSAASCAAVYVIGENPIQSEADQERTKRLMGGARLPGRPGHLPDRDGGDRRRRPAGRAPRGPSPRARSRTPSGASSGCARRWTRRARRARTSGSSTRSPGGWATTGARRRPRRPGTSCASLSPVHEGMTYAAARGAGRDPVAVLGRGAPGRAVPPLAPLGGPGARAAGAVRRRSITTRRSTSSTPTSRSGSRPAGASTRTTPASSPAATRSPLRRGEIARHLARGRGALRPGRGRARPGHLAPRVDRGRRSASTRRCGPA